MRWYRHKSSAYQLHSRYRSLSTRCSPLCPSLPKVPSPGRPQLPTVRQIVLRSVRGLTSGALAVSTPRSKSSSRISASGAVGIGIAAEGESFLRLAAWVWTSSSDAEPSEPESSSFAEWWWKSKRSARRSRFLRRLPPAGDSEREPAAALVLRAMERTTSPLQMGQVRRRVVSHGVLVLWSVKCSGRASGYAVKRTYMHSAWNSCPQGRLITLLTPSSYSSKHTTHSRWRPP